MEYIEDLTVDINSEHLLNVTSNDVDINIKYESDFTYLVDYLYDNVIMKYKENYPVLLGNYKYEHFYLFLENTAKNKKFF